MGAPYAPVDQLVGMLILKDGFGFSEVQLFEACRFQLLFRQALGLVNLNDPPPTESTYYLFRKRIYEYDHEHGTDLLGQVFEAITCDQLLEFDIGGQAISKRPRSKRNQRNNVEASIWHLTHTMRKDKTSYQGLILMWFNSPSLGAENNKFHQIDTPSACSGVVHSNTNYGHGVGPCG